MKRYFAKGMALVLSASMIVGTSGCGGAETEAVSTSASSEAASVANESEAGANVSVEVESTETTSTEDITYEKITDNGKPIADFDEFVNGEWKKAQEEKNIGSVYSLDTETNLMNERISAILADTDLSKLSEDDGLYKAVFFYNQFLDTSDIDVRIETFKKHLKPIESVKNLEDLYELYGDEEYAIFSDVLKFKVQADMNGYNSLVYSPTGLTAVAGFYYNLITNPIDDTKEIREQYLSMMETLGYSKDRTIEILENSMKVSGMIDEYLNSESGLCYIDKSALEAENVSVPVIDILVNLNAFGKKRRFTAKENFGSFIEKVHQPENVEMLRDYVLYSAIAGFSSFMSEEFIKTQYGMDYSQEAYMLISKLATDPLNKEYQRIYLDEGTLEYASSMSEDLSNVMRSLISDSEWLTPHGKELAKHKILNMHASFGLNGVGNYFEDLQMTDNVLENYINMLICRDRFYRKQTVKEDEQRELFNADLYEINGRYFPNNNAYVVTNGLLGADRLNKSSSYEEKLALLGACMAHEMGHSYDSTSINYDYHAYYEPWMTDEESAAYGEKVDSIIDFFDGMEAEYGEKIDGRLVCNEVIADIISIECCLNLLEQQENPDYDLFFRTYAADHAYYYTQEGAAYAVKDEHLPGKQRINYILGQFDKFYEIYDIDESSPFFVPSEKRISIF